MTPQEFAETIDMPETLRHVAIVANLPLYTVSQWMNAARQALGVRFDSYEFRINPMRLHGYIDGRSEPRLSVIFYGPSDKHAKAPTPETHPAVIFLRELHL